MVVKRKAIRLNGLIVIKDLEHFDEGVYFLKIKHTEDGISVIRQLIKF